MDKGLYVAPKHKKKDRPKLTRKQRKELRRKQIAFEKKLIAEEKILPRGNYRPRGFFWRVLALCVSFFLGIWAGLGGLIGGIALIGTQGSTRDLLGLIGLKTDNLLHKQYADMPALELAQTIIDQINEMPNSFMCIEDIAKYTPLLDEYLEEIIPELEALGVHMDVATLKATRFDNIADFLWDDVIPSVKLGEVLQLGTDVDMERLEDQAMFYTLAYGEFGKDYRIDASGSIEMINGSKETTIDDLLGEGEGKGINSLLKTLPLGSMLGLDLNVTEKKLTDSAMLYSLCYGSRDEQYQVENGLITMLGDNKPTVVDELMSDSDGVLDKIELGSMLGLDTAGELEKRKDNALMYSLCYGTEGVDYIVTDDNKIEIISKREPTTVGKMTGESTEIINGIVLESMLGIDADSDAMMRFIAYGPEMAKNDDGTYIMDEDDPEKYATEDVLDENKKPTGKQYVGGGRYVVEENDDGTKSVVMLPDLEKNDGSLYAKKTLGDLTDEDAKILDGMKIGDVTEIDDSSSGLMQSIKNWTIDDLSDQDKIETLEIGDIMQIEPDENGNKPDDVSGIMWALRGKTIGHLKQQSTIDSLKLGDVLEIDAKSSGIMQAMKDWSLSDLSEQERIDRLHLGQILDITEDSSRLMNAMKNWRISDLTKQEKIDSLTLGDVLEIDEDDPDTPRIMKSLKGKQIGNLGDDINSMRLSDILEPEDLESNKILRNLKMSSLDTLSQDVENISVKEVFGDELYSYMEIKGGKDYLTVLKAYDPNVESSPRPENYFAGKEGFKAQTYRVLKSTPATELKQGWFDAENKFYPETEVYRASGDVVSYYVEAHKSVTAVTEWQYMDYTKDEDGKALGLQKLPSLDFIATAAEAEGRGCTVDPYAGTDGYQENGEQLYYVTHIDDAYVAYPILTNGYDIFYTFLRARGDEEPVEVRTELEKVINGYENDGEPVVEAETPVFGDEKTGYYIAEQTAVTQKWYSEGADGAKTPYEESATEERYRVVQVSPEGAETVYKPDGNEVRLDRYLSGVWMLLFGELEEVDGKITGIKDNTNKEILTISDDITQVAGTISSTELWKLYLFDIVESDPYVELPTIDPGHGSNEGVHLHAGSANDKWVKNLNECTVVDCIDLVAQLAEGLSGD